MPNLNHVSGSNEGTSCSDVKRDDVFIFPASFSQQQLWVLDQLDPGSAYYNLPIAYRLEGVLDLPALQASLEEIVQRHEALRTIFESQDGKLEQLIVASLKLEFPVVDLVDQADREAEMQQLANKEAQLSFNLQKGPLLRVKLFRLAEKEHVLTLVMHHIISDGWSMGVLFNELKVLYGAFSQGQPSPLVELPVQYADFTVWQRDWLQGVELDRQLGYWKKSLAGLNVLELPSDHPRPKVQSHRGGWQNLSISPELTTALKALASQKRTTLFLVLTAAFQVLLHRYSGQDDIAMGTPVAGRNRQELEGLIGFLVNTLVLRGNLSGDPTFLELLARVSENAFEAYAHQDLPFEKLVEELQPPRDLSRNPLFQVMFAMQNAPAAETRLSGLTLSPVFLQTGTSRFDLTMFLGENGKGGLEGALEYNTDLFEPGSIERLAGNFRVLLEGIAAHPDGRLSELPLLTDLELYQQLDEWNRTQADYRQEKTISQAFAEQVARTPDSAALSYRDTTWTYRELDQRADMIAQQLRAAGACPEAIIGICMERCFDLVAGMLGILKTGAAYLPMDPAYPADRLVFMVEDARPLLVVSNRRTSARLSALDVQIHLVDGDIGGDGPNSRPNDKEENARGSSLAYVIYTSGSTGKPKGVMVEHQNVMNLFAGMDAVLGREPGTWLAVISVSFDPSVLDLFWTLTRGYHVIIWPGIEESGDNSIPDLIRNHSVTHVITVPSFLRMLMLLPGGPEALASLRRIIAGGEPLSSSLLRELGPVISERIVNMYGPTEATVVSTTWEVDPQAASIPIGRPIVNMKIFVLDPHCRLVPVGVVGELYIGGAGVARGYLNRSLLTEEKFIQNPFGGAADERLYRTGDLVRYRPDGMLEFIGRIDDQVKIRGFRVELGEIESVLGMHPALREVVVDAQDTEKCGKRLVAYVVPGQSGMPSVNELRQWVRRELPAYMIPGVFVALDEIPRTANGKLDRRSLPSLTGSCILSGNAEKLPTSLEAKLAEIWCEVLSIEHVSLNDNFFELGGDEILSVLAADRSRRAGLQIAPRQFFEHQTLKKIAAASTAMEELTASEPVGTSRFLLTPVQKWFFERQLNDCQHWNQAYVFELKEQVDVDLLESSIAHVLLHHDALRLRFTQVNGTWCQEYGDSVAWFRLHREDLSEVPSVDQPTAVTDSAAQLQTTLSLRKGRLFCAAYYDLGSTNSARLFIAVHHLAVDLVSWVILLEDMELAYRQLLIGQRVRLPAKTTSFRQWAHRLSDYASSAVLQEEAAYWRAIPTSPVPLLAADLSEDGLDDEASAETVVVRLTPDQTRNLLQRVSPVYRTQINDILLAGLALTFRRYTHTESLLLYLEEHGREELWEDVHIGRTVGWFTSLFPVNLQLTTDSPGEAIMSVRDQLRQIPNHGLGYGVLNYLVSDAASTPEQSRCYQPELTFKYLGQVDRALNKTSLLRLASESPGPIHSPGAQRLAKIEINGLVLHDCLELHWSFSRRRHRRSTIESVALLYLQTLNELIKHCLDLEQDREGSSSVPPRNAIEEQLIQIWAAVLDVPQVGIYDDFFELGGNSLLAIQMISRIQKTFKAEMPLQVMFEASTVAGLAERLVKVIGIASKSEPRQAGADTGGLEPRTETERKVLAIWERLLNVHPIGVRDSFLEMQGQKNLFEEMLTEIRNTFGVFAEGFPVKTFFEEPTIEALAGIIDSNIEQKDASLVVCLQPSGAESPLFLIHAGGGYVFFYRALALRLGKDRPVYGIRAETESDGLKLPFAKSKSIEEIAAHYISEIKAVRPEGPYSLGGACVGGAIAFEMARQLNLRGEKVVGAVLVFDGYVHNNPLTSLEEEEMIFEKLKCQPQVNLLRLLRHRCKKHFQYAVQRKPWMGAWYIAYKIVHNVPSLTLSTWDAARHRISKPFVRLTALVIQSKASGTHETAETMEHRQKRLMQESMSASFRLLFRYKPCFYEGSIAIFKCSNSSVDIGKTWFGLARGKMSEFEMPGVHLDMMEEPAVKKTAALVRESLQSDNGMPTAATQNQDAIKDHIAATAEELSRKSGYSMRP